ncbi:hypothetical protein ACTSEZ_04855 [Metabacillus sp. JX24]|uniref:hypothetical protein n=1 Tax=Metabacillus sp. JX24 TaxID=3240759 RepID=UPI00350EC7CC
MGGDAVFPSSKLGGSWEFSSKHGISANKGSGFSSKQRKNSSIPSNEASKYKIQGLCLDSCPGDSAFRIVQLHQPTPLPEQNPRKRQARPFWSISYLSIGAKRLIPLFWQSRKKLDIPLLKM